MSSHQPLGEEERMLLISSAGVLAATFAAGDVWKMVAGMIIYTLSILIDTKTQLLHLTQYRAIRIPVAFTQFVASCSIFLLVCRLQGEDRQKHSMLSTSQHVFSMALFGACRTMYHIKDWSYDAVLQLAAFATIILCFTLGRNEFVSRSGIGSSTTTTTDWATFMFLLLSHALFLPASAKTEKLARVACLLGLMMVVYFSPVQRFRFYYAAMPAQAKVFVAVWSAMLAARSFSVVLTDMDLSGKEEDVDDAHSGLAFAGILAAAYCISSMHVEHGNSSGSYNGENYMFQGMLMAAAGTGCPVIVQQLAATVFLSRLRDGKKFP